MNNATTARIASPGWGFQLIVEGCAPELLASIAAAVEASRVREKARWLLEVNARGLDVQLADGEHFAPALNALRAACRAAGVTLPRVRPSKKQGRFTSV